MKTRCHLPILLAVAFLFGGCHDKKWQTAAAKTGGDPHRGKVAIEYYGCASCHTIPGIPGADALVGPSLAQVSERAYLAGVLRNTPTNLIQWIKNPPAIDSKTAMPNLNIPDTDAKNIASYLYTLR
jgi:cytochrome c